MVFICRKSEISKSRWSDSMLTQWLEGRRREFGPLFSKRAWCPIGFGAILRQRGRSLVCIGGAGKMSESPVQPEAPMTARVTVRNKETGVTENANVQAR